MEHYSFKRIILKDKILLLFFAFLLVNSLSYVTSLFFGSTLIPVRIGFLAVLFWLLFLDRLKFQPIDKINNRYVAFFLFFYTVSLLFNTGFSETLFYVSLVIAVVVISFFIDYLSRHYSAYSDKILLDIIFFSLLFFPLILMLTPWNIRLNLYGSDSIEAIGLKSRYLGWASAVIYGILLYRFKQKKPVWWEKAFAFILILFVIITGSRSSLLGISIVTILYALTLKNKALYLVAGATCISIFLVLFSNQIGSYSEQVSFQKREEAKEEGLSVRTYREDVLNDAVKMSWGNVGGFFLGFGPGKFKETISKNIRKYRFNELSSHNTYLEVFITGGIFCFIAFVLLYLILPLKNFYLKKRELLFVFLPIILIAATEDNFGLGQFLFVTFSLLAFYSFKL